MRASLPGAPIRAVPMAKLVRRCRPARCRISVPAAHKASPPEAASPGERQWRRLTVGTKLQLVDQGSPGALSRGSRRSAKVKISGCTQPGPSLKLRDIRRGGEVETSGGDLGGGFALGLGVVRNGAA
jgi:hypothetical protein